MAQASEKATAAAQILKGDAVEPTARSEPATTTTAPSNLAAVQSFLALPSAVRKGRPPGSTNRPVQASSRSSTQDQPGQPKGPGHEQFPLTTWSLTVSRVSKDPKNNDVPPEFLANIKRINVLESFKLNRIKLIETICETQFHETRVGDYSWQRSGRKTREPSQQMNATCT